MMSDKYTVEVVSESQYDLGEGPHWYERDQVLYFVDAFVGDFVRLDPVSKKDQKVQFDDVVTIIIPYEEGRGDFLVTKWTGLYRLNWESKALTLLREVEDGQERNTRFNDGKCDAKGRLWVGTMGVESSPGVVVPDQGSLYSMDSGLIVDRKVRGVSLSNGIAWSLDNSTMYFIDSTKRHVYAFDFNLEQGTVSNQRVIFDFNGHPECGADELPDGMTIDREGKLWVASFYGGRIMKIDPNSGTLMESVALPAKKITSLCFGGQEMDTLYVTSARKGLTPEEIKDQPLAGSIFKVTFNESKPKGFVGVKFLGE
jgi:sugar lactone lactonase YvrE